MKMTNEANGYAYQNDPALSDKWKFRFDFFQKHGVSELWGATPEFKSAVKALNFAQRIKINVNFYAVFFPFIYFFIIGLWRQAVIVLGTALALGIIGGILGLPDGAMNGMGIAIALTSGLRANVLYYQKKVLGRDDWRI